MREIIWSLFAIFTINGEVHEERLESFRRPIDCAEMLKMVIAIPFEELDYECRGHYKEIKYNSRPSWMTDEQLADLLAKQKRNR